jgi:hypothetical protein
MRHPRLGLLLLSSAWLLSGCQAQPGNATPQAEPKAPAQAPAAASPQAAATVQPEATAAAAKTPEAPGAAATAPAGAVRPVSASGTAASGTAADSAGAKAIATGAGDKPAAAPKAAREPRKGPAVSEEPFAIWLEGETPLDKDQPATVRVVLQAKPPYHCNAEYPHKFTLADAPAGFSYPTAVVKGMKVTEMEGVLPVPIVAGAPGQASVKGKLAFSVCTAERCLVEKRDLALDLEVR